MAYGEKLKFQILLSFRPLCFAIKTLDYRNLVVVPFSGLVQPTLKRNLVLMIQIVVELIMLKRHHMKSISTNRCEAILWMTPSIAPT